MNFLGIGPLELLIVALAAVVLLRPDEIEGSIRRLAATVRGRFGERS